MAPPLLIDALRPQSTAESLHTLNRHGEVRLTDAGRDVIADAMRRATGCTMAVVNAITAEICAPGVRLVDLVETATGYSPRIDIQHHGRRGETVARAFDAANVALGLARHAHVPRASGRAEVAEDALRRVAALQENLRPGGAGNDSDFFAAEDAARRAVEIARAALEETAAIDYSERHPGWDATHDVFRIEYTCEICGCGHAWSEVHWDELDAPCPRCGFRCAPLHVETLGGEVV